MPTSTTSAMGAPAALHASTGTGNGAGTGTGNDGALVARTPHDSLVRLLAALVGLKVILTLKGGVRYQAILASTTTGNPPPGATAEGDLVLSLRQAQQLDTPQPSQVRPLLSIAARDVHELHCADVALDARASTGAAAERDSFRTDAHISDALSPSPGLERRRGKELQAWSGGSAGGDLGGIDDSLDGMTLDDHRGGARQAWDQFAANEKLYGTKTNYHEELYTTKLDRSGADYRAREQRAAQLEREILKGSSGLANNAHVAEERNEIADESGLNEEDKYSGVIRSEGAYVPPGARKVLAARLASSTNGTSPSPAPAVPRVQEPSNATPTRPAQPGAVAPTPPASKPSLETDFRQFVSAEKERLTQKKQSIKKAAERKDQDSRLASLLEFSQTFKLKSPMPPDVAAILGRDPNKKTESASTVTSPVQPPARPPPPRAITPASTNASTAAALTSSSNNSAASTAPLSKIKLPEIPPYNPNRAKVKATELAAAPASATASVPEPIPPRPSPAPPTASTSKINPAAPAFVFKPNPNATSFTPSSFAPKKPVVDVPFNAFFGSKPVKKGSSSMHVKEDFDPFKNGLVPEAFNIPPTWTFTGKSYMSVYPASPKPPSRAPPSSGGDDDPSAPNPLPLHHIPPPGPQPPPGYMYQQFPPTFQRFQPPPTQMQMPPAGMQFQPYPGMPFPPPPPSGPMFAASPQLQPQQTFIRYPFQPPPGGQNGVMTFMPGPPPPMAAPQEGRPAP